jgi:CRP-like cAMP-binding protein
MQEFEKEEETEGLYILLNGHCDVVHPSDGFVSTSLRKGDIIGES